MNRINSSKRVKAGRSAQSVADRRRLFVEAYLTNGHNGAQAAIAAGFGAKHAKRQAVRVLAEPAVRSVINARSRQVAEVAEITTEAWAREVRAVAFSRPGQLLKADGSTIPLHELPDHVQAALSSVNISKDGSKYRFWDKNTALVTMAKHLGLFEKDETQTHKNLRVVVELVG